ncbi:MAG: hypothetical protein AAGN82_07080 [Myxococcota bacterium]
MATLLALAVTVLGCARNGGRSAASEQIVAPTVLLPRPSSPSEEGDPAEPTDAMGPSEEAAGCDERVDALAAWLKQLLVDGPSYSSLPEDVVLTDADEPASGYPLMSTLYVTQGVMMLDGRLAGSPRGLGRAGAPGRSALETRLTARRVSRLLFLVDARMQWATVAAVVGVLARAGVREVVVPYRGKSRLEPPRGEAAEHWKQVSRPADASGPATTLGTKVKPSRFDKQVEHCPQIRTEFARAIKAEDTASAEKGNELFAGAITAGLRACRCRVDLDEYRAFMWMRMNRFHHPPVWTLSLPLASGNTKTAAKQLSLPANTLWPAATSLLRQHTSARPVLFVVSQ